jgi:hypothetical protein
MSMSICMLTSIPMPMPIFTSMSIHAHIAGLTGICHHVKPEATHSKHSVKQVWRRTHWKSGKPGLAVIAPSPFLLSGASHLTATELLLETVALRWRESV